MGVLFVFQELNARKQENLQIEYSREHRNDLLDYLRSLDTNMVIASNVFLVLRFRC